MLAEEPIVQIVMKSFPINDEMLPEKNLQHLARDRPLSYGYIKLRKVVE